MSTKLKINIVLLIAMFASTMYFLKAIDVQERIVVSYQAEQYEKQKRTYDDFEKLMGAPVGQSSSAITYEQSLKAKQYIKEHYRYMFATEALLILSILVVSSTLNKRAV